MQEWCLCWLVLVCFLSEKLDGRAANRSLGIDLKIENGALFPFVGLERRMNRLSEGVRLGKVSANFQQKDV